jgi:cytosine/adenosine deaminase-related metal-dependent hydrolase
MLMAMWLVGLLTRLGTDADYEEIFKMATYNGARAMGLDNYGLGKGRTADLVLLDAKNATEAIGFQARRLLVLKHGRIVARDGALLDDGPKRPETARTGSTRNRRWDPAQP